MRLPSYGLLRRGRVTLHDPEACHGCAWLVRTGRALSPEHAALVRPWPVMDDAVCTIYLWAYFLVAVLLAVGVLLAGGSP